MPYTSATVYSAPQAFVDEPIPTSSTVVYTVPTSQGTNTNVQGAVVTEFIVNNTTASVIELTLSLGESQILTTVPILGGGSLPLVWDGKQTIPEGESITVSASAAGLTLRVNGVLF